MNDRDRIDHAIQLFIRKAGSEESNAVKMHSVSLRKSDEHSGFAQGMSYAAHVLGEMFDMEIDPILEREKKELKI